MTAAPNVRNGNLAPDGPNLFSSDTHQATVVVRANWSLWSHHRPVGGTWEDFDLSTIAGNPLALPIVSGDSHYVAVTAIDGKGRVHVLANMHNDELRYVVCTNPAAFTNPASWADASSWITFPGGAEEFSYSTFIPLPDGRLLLAITQNDNLTVLGRDVLLFQLGPTDDAWTPGPGTTDGHLAVVNETDNDGDPERAYFVGACVSPEGRVGWFGSWAENHDDNWRRWPYYIELDSEAGDQWRTVDGTSVTLPLTYNGTNATSTYSACEIDTFDEITVSSYPAFDENGRPNIVLQESVTNQRHRCYWTGTAWANASGNSAGGLYLIHGQLWRFEWGADLFVKLRPLAVNAPVRLSGTCPARFDPHPDPRRLWHGEVAFMVPDGNLPRVYSFGAGPRVRNT